MQIRTTVRYQLTPTRISVIKKIVTIGEDVEKWETLWELYSIYAWGNFGAQNNGCIIYQGYTAKMGQSKNSGLHIWASQLVHFTKKLCCSLGYKPVVYALYESRNNNSYLKI